MAPPTTTVYSNVSGRPYADVDEIRAHLLRQIEEPVQWETIMRSVCALDDADDVLQVGGGESLLALLRKLECPLPACGVR